MEQRLPQTPQRFVLDGVALETDRTAAGTGVTFCFSERSGGVSQGPWASLNLGDMTDDDPACVTSNRHKLLAAMGAEDLAGRLVVPRQVHGERIAVLTANNPTPQPWIRQGCDGVVCTTYDIPVLLVFADCVPVILIAKGGFAVVHSGWRGTYARIAAKAASLLCDALCCEPSQISAYIGPHIMAQSYEVSPELCDQFVGRFGPACVPFERHLDLGMAIRQTLMEKHLEPDHIVDCGLDTFTHADRFFSYRAQHGITGRHGALAFMRSDSCPERL